MNLRNLINSPVADIAQKIESQSANSKNRQTSKLQVIQLQSRKLNNPSSDLRFDKNRKLYHRQ